MDKGTGKRSVLFKIVLYNLLGIGVALAVEAALLLLGFLQESDIPRMFSGAIVFLFIVDIGWYVRGVW